MYNYKFSKFFGVACLLYVISPSAANANPLARLPAWACSHWPRTCGAGLGITADQGQRAVRAVWNYATDETGCATDQHNRTRTCQISVNSYTQKLILARHRRGNSQQAAGQAPAQLAGQPAQSLNDSPLEAADRQSLQALITRNEAFLDRIFPQTSQGQQAQASGNQVRAVCDPVWTSFQACNQELASILAGVTPAEMRQLMQQQSGQQQTAGTPSR